MASAYQGAVEAVLAVVICAGVGFWLDHRYGWSPRGLFIGMIIGFAAFGMRLWRMRDLVGGVSDDAPSDPGSSTGGTDARRPRRGEDEVE